MTLLDISSWWQSMAGLEKIFWTIAILFSILFLIQTIMSFAGGDGDEAFGDADTAIGEDGGIDYGYFTIKNFIAFFTIFGWTGIAMIKGDTSPWITIGVSLIAGVIVVAMMMFLFRSMSKLKQSGTMIVENAIGNTAETYLRIPGGRNGYGKVHIKIQGSLREMQAVTDETTDIPTGRLVRVISIVNSNVLVVSSSLS